MQLEETSECVSLDVVPVVSTSIAPIGLCVWTLLSHGCCESLQTLCSYHIGSQSLEYLACIQTLFLILGTGLLGELGPCFCYSLPWGNNFLYSS